MLKIVVPGAELWDERIERFYQTEEVTIVLEHSLLSVSKWESEFNKPFLGPTDKTAEEIFGYVRAMDQSGNFTEEVIPRIRQSDFDRINEYIGSTYSATTFQEFKPAGSAKNRGEVITSELIYYWMTTFQVPFEAESWHLNRLFALLRICSIKNTKQKKMTPAEIAARNKQINEQRRAQMGTSG